VSALATYTDLVSEVQDWLFGRTDIAAKVPTFVRLLEAKANRNLQCRQMETRATTNVNLAATEPQFVTLPDAFQIMKRIRCTSAQGKPNLKFLTPVQMADKREELDDTAGDPIWFSIFGSEMELLPTPVNNPTTLEMVYRCNLPPLATAVSGTNWLLDMAPDFYLFGTLMQAAPYLHEDERIETWKGGLADALAELNSLSDQALHNAGPLTMRRRGRAY
jgi:hypothetical protein